MRGIATIDRQPDSDTIALWVTSSSEGMRGRHVNAVVIDSNTDPDASEKLRSLTRSSLVLLTDGSTLDGLPVEGGVLTTADIDDLVAQTEAHQEAIVAAVREHNRATWSHLKYPTFGASPQAADYLPSEDTPSGRAFATANYLSKAWSGWLKAEEERRRRRPRPVPGETPEPGGVEVMPAELNDPEVAVLPAGILERADEQPLV